MMPSGASRSLYALALVVPLLLTGCLYGFSNGGGLPRNLRSVAIQPFDNLTASSELQRDLLEEMRKGMRDRLNLREEAEAKAHVLVRGSITTYEVDLTDGVSADPRQTSSTRRRLQLAVDIEVLDQTTGRTLFTQKGMSAQGQYPEGGEPTGRRLAIESLVNEIVNKMQSQW